MSCEIEFTNERGAWVSAMDEEKRVAVDHHERIVPVTDDRYDVYLVELRRDGRL